MEIYRNGFAEFGRWNDCVILSPLFPVGVLGDGNGDGYKQLVEGDIRYDQVLLDMVASVGQKYNRASSRSPCLVTPVADSSATGLLPAPREAVGRLDRCARLGMTLLDPKQNWWVGVRDFETRFAKPLDLDALRQVPIHMVVGEADLLENLEITHREGGKHYARRQ